MWTPKRIVLLGLGFTMFLTVYIVYACFLGGIDGLPALPEGLGPPDDGKPIILGPATQSEADRKLCLAFGPDCPQVNKQIRMEIRKPINGIKILTFGVVKVSHAL